MKASRVVALVDGTVLVGLWAAGTMTFQSWPYQVADPLVLVMFLAALLLSVWRIDVAYRRGPILATRAIAEGLVCGAALPATMQVLFWAYLWLANVGSTSGIVSLGAFVSLAFEAVLGGAFGASVGCGLWLVNVPVSRRLVF